ncbi:MAG: helix-turn-helix domain-containing protein [Brachybacterium tyrofermentans]|uniref:helix-turn-helix domain-containing protein n=1 Tax=Brachybacterium tyrofermentans TaxID=47848 RepID=UPI001865DA14|nr:helix-turn-helix domain-containing protein [Brachybacterium tyrofermentans]
MTGPNAVRAPRIKRECEHKYAKHVHGTATAYKLDRCRCAPCTDACTAEERRRRLDAHIGAAPRRIDAGPVRAHIKAMQAEGLGYRRVAALAGLAPSTVLKIVRRDPKRVDGMPQQRVAPDTARRILAVTASPAVLSEGVVVDATGAIRRIHALQACGWSRRQLAARLGVEHNTLNHILTTGGATGRMVRAITALYEELWNAAPPAATAHERAAITRTLRTAKANGWAVPMSWDEDAIDDPAARPVQALAERASARERLDELEWLLRAGVGFDVAARQAGYSSWDSAQSIARRRGHAVADLKVRVEVAA